MARKRPKIKGQKRHNRSYSSMDGMKTYEECLLNDPSLLETRLIDIVSRYDIKVPLEKFKKGGQNN